MPSSAHPDGGRRALQVTMGVLAGIPVATGLLGMLTGPAALPGDHSTVEASLESEYRFASTFWCAVGPLLWWTLPRVEERTSVVQAALGTVMVGGVGRLLAWRKAGRPHPAFVGALALEFVGMPIVLVWQRHVAALAQGRK
jgi:Domain of unknown function (DUF4345)